MSDARADGLTGVEMRALVEARGLAKLSGQPAAVFVRQWRDTTTEAKVGSAFAPAPQGFSLACIVSVTGLERRVGAWAR